MFSVVGRSYFSSLCLANAAKKAIISSHLSCFLGKGSTLAAECTNGALLSTRFFSQKAKAGNKIVVSRAQKQRSKKISQQKNKDNAAEKLRMKNILKTSSASFKIPMDPDILRFVDFSAPSLVDHKTPSPSAKGAVKEAERDDTKNRYVSTLLSSFNSAPSTPSEDEVLRPGDMVLSPLSLKTANQKDIVKYRKAVAIKKFQNHKTDTGSAQTQIACMTERIKNIVRHLAANKQDKVTKRALQLLVSKRKSMMQYLKRQNFELFESTAAALGLQKEAFQIK